MRNSIRKKQGFSRIMIQIAGWVRRLSISRRSSRVGSEVFAISRGGLEISWVGSGRVGSGRVGSGRVGSGRVGSGRVGSGRVGLGRVGSGRVGSP